MDAKLTPHQRIMRAAKAGKGLRLTADEVWKLSMDGAIETRAGWDDCPEDENEERAASMGALAERMGRDKVRALAKLGRVRAMPGPITWKKLGVSV